MLPKWHILIGFIASYILVYFLNFSLLAGIVIFLSSWLLIDLDHYLRYVFITHNISLIGFWEWSMEQSRRYNALTEEQKSKEKRPIFIFHGIEFWFILAMLSLLSPIFLWILMGIGIHLLADWPYMIYKREPFYIKFSPMYTFISNKIRK